MDQVLPSIPNLDSIRKRLPEIFPEGIDHRNYVVRDMCARTIYVLFYIGAIKGTDRWMRPAQVTMMSDEQALKTNAIDRLQWTEDSLTPGKLKDIPGMWYASNTREPIRDETIKNGLIATGAVIEKPGLPTTSSLPRYALSSEFANLFDENISDEELLLRVSRWQEKYLNTGALARIKLLKRGTASSKETVLVTFPNGESRRMSPGPSSVLSKSVIEVFAKKFLVDPALVFLSESGNKVIAQDNDLAASIGLRIEADRNLPDIILADLGTPSPLIIFVEVVHSDGPISALRKNVLLKLGTDAGFDKNNIVFVSAFSDKSTAAFKKLSSDIAWGSLVWFSAEPENILIYRDKETLEGKTLFELIK